jgi:hypothetical protein
LQAVVVELHTETIQQAQAELAVVVAVVVIKAVKQMRSMASTILVQAVVELKETEQATAEMVDRV